MAELTPMAGPGKEHAAVGAGAELSDEPVLDVQTPHQGHPGGRQLHKPLESCGCVLLRARHRGGQAVSWAPPRAMGGPGAPGPGTVPREGVSHGDSPSRTPPVCVSWRG